MSIDDILEALAAGKYNGARKDDETGGVAHGYYIHDGVPVRYRQGPSSRFFDGKENVRSPGVRSEERFDTDDKKVTFLEKYGWIPEMFGNHPEVIEFSSEYYERTRRS